jgi:hypothetical protein
MRGRSSRSFPGDAGCAVLIIGAIALGAIGALLDGGGDGAPPTGGPTATRRVATPAPEPTVEPVSTFLPISLRDALAADMVVLRARGENLQQMDIEIESKVELSLEIEIEAGVVFSTRSAGVQPMVVITDTHLQLEPKLSVEWELDVACASMHDDEPTSSDTFTLAPKPARADLRRLVGVDAFHDADFRVQQFAVWTITDNPSRDGYVGLGSGGAGSGPTRPEMRQIRALFEAAGIDTSRYRAFG